MMSQQNQTSDTNEPCVREFQSLPKMHATYANVIKSLVPSRDKPVGENELPRLVCRVNELVIDESNLNEYRKVCGFGADGRVPATYFAVLSQTVQMNMMTDERFPFAMLGLVHIFNEVTQYRPIFDSEIVAMTVELTNLKPHDKGQQFDFVTKVYANDKLVWQGSSTYLSRQKKPKTDTPPAKAEPKPEPKPEQSPPNLDTATLLTVPEDMGRRYAFVSGDFNLIHLHPLSARAFGFPRAIAHGMWSKAKCLAMLGKEGNLPPAFVCQVAFKQPIFLPSKVAFAYELWSSPDNGNLSEQWQFGLHSPDGNKTHLTGDIKGLSAGALSALSV